MTNPHDGKPFYLRAYTEKQDQALKEFCFGGILFVRIKSNSER